MNSLKWFVPWILIFFCLNTYAKNDTSYLSKCDVDSIGDLWIFTLDKTGSMLSEKTVTGSKIPWTPTQIKDDVIKKLSVDGGILDQINYSRDRITIMETGYGDKNKESDSYGQVFCMAPSLDTSFIHVIQPLRQFVTNKKNGLKAVLSHLLEKNDYNYRESFVSQIRVLSLHRLVKAISSKGQGLTFRKIHIVTITDDADVNDQWKMDYYTIKRDPAKMEQLNELHSKYVYSSFTQEGAGYLDERKQFTDVSSKNHIYIYDYVTRQQKVNDIICKEDSIINISPLDGKILDFQLTRKQIDSDSICFAYISFITINHVSYPVNQYMYDNKSLDFTYDMDPVRNEIIIHGKLQVIYTDSIYGAHYKSYNFTQYNNDYTALVHTVSDIAIKIIVAAILLVILFIVWIKPNRKLMTVNMSDGQQIHIRRGYRWQWEKLIPLLYYNGGKVIFAKHSCFKRKTKPVINQNCSNLIIIDSPVPLTFTGNVMSDTTKNNILKNAKDSYEDYPEALLQIYGKTWAGKIASLHNSPIRWIRIKLYPILNRLIFSINPHYYYWINVMKGLISTPLLPGRHFLLEYKMAKEKTTYDDKWLNAYYQGNYPAADVIICLNSTNNDVIWDVYQLCSRKFTGYGISSAKHLIHYKQKDATANDLQTIKRKLKKAIRREMRVSRIVCLNTTNGYEAGVHFNVSEASSMAYICLVECTEYEKCQILYSPFTDANSTEKNIVIGPCSVSRRIWTSLIPFASKKDRPSGDIAHCESLKIISEYACQKRLSLRHNTIEFDNICITPQKAE